MDLRTMVIKLTVTEVAVVTVTGMTVTVAVLIMSVPGQNRWPDVRLTVTETVKSERRRTVTEVTVAARTVTEVTVVAMTVTVSMVTMAVSVAVTILQLRLGPNVPGRAAGPGP
jgi:uncharacterized membrane protein